MVQTLDSASNVHLQNLEAYHPIFRDISSLSGAPRTNELILTIAFLLQPQQTITA